MHLFHHIFFLSIVIYLPEHTRAGCVVVTSGNTCQTNGATCPGWSSSTWNYPPGVCSTGVRIGAIRCKAENGFCENSPSNVGVGRIYSWRSGWDCCTVCSCTNGVGATGAACTSHGAAICGSCSAGYYLSGGACPLEKRCTCTNGSPVVGATCQVYNQNGNVAVNRCASCDSNYYLAVGSGSCHACSTCPYGTYQTRDCSASQNRACTSYTCSCSNGYAATGASCTSVFPTTAKCSSCFRSHYLSLLNTHWVCLLKAACTGCVAGTRATSACSNAANRACGNCDVGQYQSSNTFTGTSCAVCDACVAGKKTTTQCSKTANRACGSCDAGQFQSSNTFVGTTCILCASSGNGDNAATVTCTSESNQVAASCIAGYGFDGIKCTACVVGEYSPGNTAACSVCPASFFTDTLSADTGTTCTPCASVPGSSARTCDGAGAGAIQTVTCVSGYYVSGTAGGSDLSCTFCASSGNGENAATISCTSGSNQVATSCNAGYGFDGIKCAACVVGEYSPGNNNTNACLECTAGQYQSSNAFTGTNCSVCTGCGAGEKQTTQCSGAADDRACSKCDGGQYQSSNTFTGISCALYSTCDAGTKEFVAPSATNNRVCSDFKCTCADGTGATGLNCPVDGTEKCTACNNRTSKFLKTSDMSCQPWTVCNVQSEYETVSPTATRNRECIKKECTCEQGVGFSGSSCPNHGDLVRELLFLCDSCTFCISLFLFFFRKEM